MDISLDDGACPFCGDDLLEDGKLYVDGEQVTCATCGKVCTVCASPEDGLWVHGEEDHDGGR